jgi:diacylglycerol kinase family enzyme
VHDATAVFSPPLNDANAVTVIVNARAGGGEGTRAAEISRAFSRVGASASVQLADGGRELIDLAERAAAKGDLLVAAGGDGTVNAVASVAVRNGATLGVVPLGTLNHFARDAGIPLDTDAAVRAIAARHVRALDVAEVNGRVFVNNSSLGLYPRLVWERQQEQQRGRRKWIAFGIALLRTWRRYRTLTVRLSIDGREHVRRTPFVFIGNNEYTAEGLQLGGRAALDRGNLSVYVAPQCGRLELLALPFRALAGKLDAAVTFEGFLARDVRVHTARPRVSVAMDGEVTIAQAPLHYRIRPGALRVIVPAP